jgi:hydroxypyruvate reductase
MPHPMQLQTTSLHRLLQGAAVANVLAAALQAADPATAVRRALQRDGDMLIVGGRRYDLAQYERVLLAAIGKAGAPMAAAVCDLLGERLTAGVVVVKEGHLDAQAADPCLTMVEAGHPQPDERSVAGGRAVYELLESAGERDLVIALISGGGSALATLPAPGLTLADMQELTAALLRCGAAIGEINTLRKHLDRVKGGGLALAAGPAAVITLVLSDVVGSPLDVIASGPTVADTSSYADALQVLERYRITGDVPPAIVAHLRRGAAGELPETLKPHDPRLAHVQNLVIASNREAAEGAREAAAAAGFDARVLTQYDAPAATHTIPPADTDADALISYLAAPIEGEAREIGALLARLAQRLDEAPGLTRPACLIVGGETTVTIRGNGRGGRNQELALAAVARLAGLHNVLFVTLATDGGDGPTDAAGATVTGETLARARALGLDPADFLARNDAYAFFDALGDLLRPGPTLTNVNDLAFLFIL